MTEYVMQIDFVDCPGLGYAIFQATEVCGADKVAMEVLPGKGMVLRFRCQGEAECARLLAAVRAVGGVTDVRLRERMPYEEREQELKTILNAVSEGVIAVDRQGIIRQSNELAATLLQDNGAALVGRSLHEVLPDLDVTATLEGGQPLQLKPAVCRRGEVAVSLLWSSVPIQAAGGQVLGAVVTWKEFQQVAQMADVVSRSSRHTTFGDIVYQSASMRELIQQAQAVAKSRSTILIRGESGTGKELIARAIHNAGGRQRGPFIAVNCAALPDTLLESELFGYVGGSFTGALKQGKKGLFEEAQGGTLFLDEVGEVSPAVQVRLLRVLQEGTVRRIGSSREVPVDVRVVAATHRDLEQMTRCGEFRQDLYYRLNVIPLQLPPLRERVEDIPLLTYRLLGRLATELGKPQPRLDSEAVKLLMTGAWPGNVRQLENLLERIMNLVETDCITPAHIRAWGDLTPERPAAAKADLALKQQADMLQIAIPLNQAAWPSLKDIVAQVESAVLRQVWREYPSSRLAGQVLGVSNTTVLNKVKQYGLDV